MTFELKNYSKAVSQPHTFESWLTEKYFEPPWKSGPAKTRTAGLVPPPLGSIDGQLLYVFYHDHSQFPIGISN